VAREAAGGVGGANDRSARSARAAAHDPDATVMSPSPRRADVVSQDAVLFSFLFGPLRRQSTPNTDEIKECGESTYENHEHRKHHLLDPPRGLADDRPAVWVMPDARGPGRLFASHWEPDGRQRKSTSSLEIRWMARPRPERKSEPEAPTERRVLPMQLQISAARRRDRRVGSDRPPVHDGGWEGRARPRSESGQARWHRDPDLAHARASARPVEGRVG
jgi:hypothetical protein